MHAIPAPTAWWRAALVALTLLVVLTLLKLAIPAIGRPTPFLTYFAAILAAAWYGGMAAGLVATAASAILGCAVCIEGAQGLDRARGGLGLGLTIVKSLVELHGGRVSAASEGEGKGSELEVRLPAAPRDAAAAR